MSTVANAKEKNSTSASATGFIAAIAVSALAMTVASVFETHSWHQGQFAALLALGVLTARLKVKLPGLNGNMSVSLPFLFIAMTRLSLPEMLLTAAASVFAQSLPKAPQKFNAVHALFNVSSSILATGLGWEAFHHGTAVRANVTASLLLGAVSYLLASTIPLAGIISLTEKQNVFHTWSEIVHLSFPYYVASTGLTSIALSLQGNTTWSLLVGMSLVAVVMYQSYRRYFTSSVSGTPAPTAYKASAAGAQ